MKPITIAGTQQMVGTAYTAFRKMFPVTECDVINCSCCVYEGS